MINYYLFPFLQVYCQMIPSFSLILLYFALTFCLSLTTKTYCLSLIRQWTLSQGHSLCLILYKLTYWSLSALPAAPTLRLILTSWLVDLTLSLTKMWQRWRTSLLNSYVNVCSFVVLDTDDYSMYIVYILYYIYYILWILPLI